MLLKKINKILILLLIFLNFKASSEELESNNKKILIEYFNKFNEFSSMFIQSNGKTLEEGNIYFQNKRIRIEYYNPSNLLLVIAKNKAMYFNQDLQEVEYFNPEKTVAKIFFDIFYDNFFLENASYKEKNQSIYLEKKIKLSSQENIELTIIFEKNPLIIRKILIKDSAETTSYSIINPKFNLNLKKNFFSMANPLL